jgi:hypothetical protein
MNNDDAFERGVLVGCLLSFGGFVLVELGVSVLFGG